MSDRAQRQVERAFLILLALALLWLLPAAYRAALYCNPTRGR